jgi:hypothetical protein
MARVVELFADCDACRLEGGVIERYDPLAAACRFGLPATTRCRLCGAASEGTLEPQPAAAPQLAGTPANECPVCRTTLAARALDTHQCQACGARAVLSVAQSPRVLDRAGIFAALDTWAHEARMTREELLRGMFVRPDVEAIAGALERREVIETVADPFARVAARPPKNAARQVGGSVGAHESAPPRADTPVRADDGPSGPPLSVAGPPSAPPRALLYPLVSVAAADGEVHPLERQLVDRFLASEGLSPLTDDECRVHHPLDVARWVPPERRAAMVDLMCQIAMIDGLPDAAELRVVEAYAAAWHVPPEQVQAWLSAYSRRSASTARQVWLAFRRILLIGVWSKREDP